MKTVRRIIVWSIASLLIQSIIFFSLNRYYNNSLLNTKVKEVLQDDKSKPKKNVNVKIPEDAQKVEASYSGRYISYYENDSLNVVDTYDGSKKTVNSDENHEQVYNKWFPDADLMIICEKDLNRKNTVYIYKYNAENNVKQASEDTNNSDIKLTLSRSTDKISDIQMSTTMLVMYIRVLRTNNTSDIINVDVNGNVINEFRASNISKIGVFKHKNNLVYQTGYNNIQITKKKFSLKQSACILGTDDNDNLYLGILKNKRVTKIIYGSIDVRPQNWQSLALDEPIDSDKIYVEASGQVFVDKGDGSIISIQPNGDIPYKGTFLKVTSEKVMSINDGKLTVKDINIK